MNLVDCVGIFKKYTVAGLSEVHGIYIGETQHARTKVAGREVELSFASTDFNGRVTGDYGFRKAGERGFRRLGCVWCRKFRTKAFEMADVLEKSCLFLPAAQRFQKIIIGVIDRYINFSVGRKIPGAVYQNKSFVFAYW